ncbi:LysR family transcriptional regulator [Variovorax sp. LjRoot84]
MDVLRLTLRQLQIFVAVAQSGSTTAASTAIALSQSATSAAVNELERLLSLRLFDRTGKRLLLNDNGRALLPRAQALLHGASGVERMARDGSAQLQALRIGASTTIGNHVLPALLAGFLDGHQHAAADWRSSVAIGNTGDICARVAAFDLDIGLIEGACHEPSLEVHPWLRDEMVVVAAPAKARRSDPAERWPVKALRDVVWLLREPGSGTREATDQALLPHLRSYRRSIELGSSEAIKHAAAAGLGVACLSRWVVDDLVRAGYLRKLATTLPAITRQCHWVVHREKQITPALRRLVGQLPDAGSRVLRWDASLRGLS